MRNLLLALLLAPSLTLAAPFQSDKTVVCEEVAVVMKHLQEKYGEVPVWTGAGTGNTDANSTLMLLQNHQTRSWTIIQFNEQVACILGVGNNTEFTKDAFGTKT